MKRIALTMLLLFPAPAIAQSPVARVANDAKVIDRVAEASKKDLPDTLLKRIVNEDVELLRGKRTDGSYEHATYERLDSGRKSSDVSVQARKDEQLQRFEIRGGWVYRLILGSPTRRMFVTRNRKVYVDRVELEFIPQGSSATKHETVKIESWLTPGSVTPVDFPEVARQATVRVFARADKESGYGNLELTLVEAKVVDNVDSPYAGAVSALKAVVKAIDANDIPSIRAMATRTYSELASKTTVAEPATGTVEVVASPAEPNPEIYNELQAIEDLLTGSESEKRQGVDRLHQLVRRLRPTSGRPAAAQ